MVDPEAGAASPVALGTPSLAEDSTALKPPAAPSFPKNGYVPTKELRHFIACLLTDEADGNLRKAEALSGISKHRFYYAFKRSEPFRRWYQEQCDRFLGMREHVVASKLVEKVEAGDTQAIRLYYELRQRLKMGTFTIPTQVIYQITHLTVESTPRASEGNGHLRPPETETMHDLNSVSA